MLPVQLFYDMSVFMLSYPALFLEECNYSQNYCRPPFPCSLPHAFYTGWKTAYNATLAPRCLREQDQFHTYSTGHLGPHRLSGDKIYIPFSMRCCGVSLGHPSQQHLVHPHRNCHCGTPTSVSHTIRIASSRIPPRCDEIESGKKLMK